MSRYKINSQSYRRGPGKSFKFERAIGRMNIFNHGIGKYVDHDANEIALVANKLGHDFALQKFTKDEYDKLLDKMPDYENGVDKLIWMLENVFDITFH